MRTLTISRGSLFLRFFLWAWGIDPEKLNICKLFWGTLLFPLASFLPVKGAYRYFLLAAFLSMINAVVAIATSWWTGAIFWVFLAAVLTIVGCVAMRRPGTRGADERQKEKEQALSVVTGRGSAIVDWILDHTIGPFFYLAGNVAYSRAGQHINGFLAVICVYAGAVKRRICPLIRVV